ncbi:hypothetical protein Vadar_017091 [Vaccinium darrowii]|uniref:Uncharacterized protein n=1 Tax=Vaccinium darrowii TaxID=229202 RepID=A0ACB7ZC60_9ERIC|nr:hypothetical protein Vadar_017091 [Vaccinium darrowii]
MGWRVGDKDDGAPLYVETSSSSSLSGNSSHFHRSFQALRPSAGGHHSGGCPVSSLFSSLSLSPSRSAGLFQLYLGLLFQLKTSFLKTNPETQQVEHKQMTPDAAYDFVTSVRPRVQLASAQWQAVQDYYIQIMKRSERNICTRNSGVETSVFPLKYDPETFDEL